MTAGSTPRSRGIDKQSPGVLVYYYCDTPMLRINPASSAPIWRQIEDGLSRLITTGILSPGDPIPSVRDLARELSVNPATVSKAYQRMVDGELLTVRRGEGTFVSENKPQLRKSERRDTLRKGADHYASVIVSVGASTGEAVSEIRGAIRRIHQERERRQA